MDAGDRATIGGKLLRLRSEGPPRLDVLDAEPGDSQEVGLVPGSFDPMTVAHAAIAEALREGGCDPVLLVYSPRTMPKVAPTIPPLLSPEARVASMLAWTSDRRGFGTALCSHGLYTDQARAAAAAFPGAAVAIGLGSDKLIQLFDPAWYEDREAALGELFALARVRYAVRAGGEARVEAVLKREAGWSSRLEPISLPSDVAGVSSSEVRVRHRDGRDVRDLVPSEVLHYLPASGGS